MNEQVVKRALFLLPKYGNFVEGAVNQAFLLEGVPFDKVIYKQVVEEVKMRLE